MIIYIYPKDNLVNLLKYFLETGISWDKKCNLRPELPWREFCSLSPVIMRKKKIPNYGSLNGTVFTGFPIMRRNYHHSLGK